MTTSRANFALDPTPPSVAPGAVSRWQARVNAGTLDGRRVEPLDPAMVTDKLGVELLDRNEEGEAFLADICSMLQAVAARCGCNLSAFTPAAGPSRAVSAEIIGAVPARLLGELGIHRGQRAPAGTPHGRIVTVRVAVTLLSDGPRPARAAVLRTYNYPVRSAVRHETGHRQDLAVVLSGGAV